MLQRVLGFVAAVAVFDVGLATPTLSSRLDITPITDAQATKRIVHSTLEVLALGCDLSLRQGTGVAVAPDRILTNEHVVGSYRRVDLAADGAALIAPRTVRTSAGADLVAIEADGLPTKPLALGDRRPAAQGAGVGGRLSPRPDSRGRRPASSSSRPRWSTT